MSVPKRIVALIDAKNEEVVRLEREKAESEYALGFAVEAVERLEAEKAVMLAALEEMADMNLCTSKGLAAIRKARGEE